MDLTLLPQPGTDTEYDEALESVLSAIRATHSTFNEDEVRWSVGILIANKRSVDITEAFAPPAPPEPEEPVEVNFDKLEKLERTAEDADFFYEPPEVTAFIDMFFEASKRGLWQGVPVAKGPAGCGKTEGWTRAATTRDLPVFAFNCGLVTSPEKWLGHKDIDENGTRYTKSKLIKRIEGIEEPPGLIVLDEINRMHPSMANPVLSLFDSRREIELIEVGEKIHPHPEVMFVATMNEGNGFGGTYPLDDALAERLSYFVPRDFPPEEAEIEVLMKRKGIKEDSATRMVWAANKTRTMWRADELRRPISTRILLAWAHLVSLGMPLSKAAEFSVVSQYRADEVQVIKQILQGKMGGK